MRQTCVQGTGCATRELGGLADQSRSVIYSLKSVVARNTAVPVYSVPRWSPAEVKEFVSETLGPDAAEANQLEKLQRVSAGLPLLIRYLVADVSSVGSSTTLMQIELRLFRGWSALARELSTYVALSDRPLRLQDLLELTGRPSQDLELLTLGLHEAAVLVAENERGYRTAHEHFAATISEDLASQPQRLTFFATRLADHFEKNGLFASAFLLYDGIGHHRARALSRRAAFDAQMNGDLRRLRPILSARLDMARDAGVDRGVVEALVALSQCLDWHGEVAEATNTMDEARNLAAKDDSLTTYVEEYRLTRLSSRIPNDENISQLVAVREGYLADGEEWAASRCALHLGVAAIHADDQPAAAEYARLALDGFVATGDLYGASLARKNLASALLLMPEREDEGEVLLAEILSAEDNSSLRWRGWECNILCSRHRRAGDYDRAEKLAQEAIEIGEELGDPHLVAINTQNLGNVHRDRGDPDLALSHYDRAASLAAESGDVVVDAHASVLGAEIVLELGRHSEAQLRAQHAIGLLKPASKATHYRSRAHEVFGDALNGQGKRVLAAHQYLLAASLDSEDGQEATVERISYLRRVAFQLLAKHDSPATYFEEVYGALGIKPPKDNTLLSSALSAMVPIISASSLRDAASCAGIHSHIMFKPRSTDLARRCIHLAKSRILEALENGDLEKRRGLLGLIGLIANSPADVINDEVLIEIGDGVTAAVDGFSFRPDNTGGGQWGIRLDLRAPVLISIVQLSDEPAIFQVATILGLFLKGFENRIGELFLADMVPPVGELDICMQPNSILEPLRRFCTRSRHPQRFSRCGRRAGSGRRQPERDDHRDLS